MGTSLHLGFCPPRMAKLQEFPEHEDLLLLWEQVPQGFSATGMGDPKPTSAAAKTAFVGYEECQGLCQSRCWPDVAYNWRPSKENMAGVDLSEKYQQSQPQTLSSPKVLDSGLCLLRHHLIYGRWRNGAIMVPALRLPRLCDLPKLLNSDMIKVKLQSL